MGFRHFLFSAKICVLILFQGLLVFSAPIIDTNLLPRPDWIFYSTTFKASNYVYTPFFISGDDFTSFTAGSGSQAGNGFHRLTTSLSGLKQLTQTTVIATGPDINRYNYFRASRIAKNGNELWMIVELSGCYSGCETTASPNRLGVYRSVDDGLTWTFLNFVTLDGTIYLAKWFAHTGLIYNPKGSSTLNLKVPAANRFITVGENRDIWVSVDGINYRSIPMNHPFPKDRLVFAALAKTPYGFHLTSAANWSDVFLTTTVRHLFSKDLMNWAPLEGNSFLKHPTFYKGVHLSFDSQSNRLWALSPCGSFDGCSFLAWLNPKDFLDPKMKTKPVDDFPVGEYVHVNQQTALITKRNGDLVTARLVNGTYLENYRKEQFTLPLKSYTREGCVANDNSNLCVGDAVYYNGNLATIMGYFDQKPHETKYAIKYSNGTVDTGYLRSMFTFP